MAGAKLGVITNNQHGIFQRVVIAGIRQAAEQYGYAVVIDSYWEEAQHPRPISLELSELAGVLVIADAAPADLLRSMVQAGKPVSLICHRVPGLPIPVVKANNAQGIAELLHHLVVRCNRRKLVFLRGLMEQNDGQEREIAFRRELIRHDLRPGQMHFVRGDFSASVAADSIRQLIDQGVRFDGILSSDFVMAIAAVETLRAAGIAVPGQVSVVGFGDDPEAEAAGLTTVAASIAELGCCATRQLVSQINGARISGVTVLNVQLVIRDTCGCRLPESHTNG
jgi:LacI family transcriptional regulator